MRSLIASLLLVAAAMAETKPPHIVFVLADDLGPGDLGCCGGSVAPTPNIDRLAKEGTRFTQFYSASPICSPSRCGLITGQYPSRWRITSFLQTKAGNADCEQADFLDPKAPSLPRELKAAGYRTAHFGKWHLGGGRDVTDAPKFAVYGYDEHAGTWESPQPHPDITATNWIWSDQDTVKRWQRTGFFVDRTLDFLKRHRDSPCFVNLWLDDPHTPWVPNAAAGKGANTKPNLKQVMIELDRQIGRLLDGIKDLDVERETLVIFASDNGPLPTFGTDRTVGLRGSKLSLYEGGIRLPFIARWPGHIPANTVDDKTVIAAIDMLPTFCKLAGRDVKAISPDGEDRSLAILGTPSRERSKPLFWEYGRNDKSFAFPGVKGDRSPRLAVRRDHWKLLMNDDGSNAELYDLAADPNEKKNLVNDAALASTVQQLKSLVMSWSNTRVRPRLPRDNLMLYRDGGTQQPVTNLNDWAKRRTELIRGVETVMGKLPGQEKRCELDMRVEEETDCGQYIRKLITYASEPGCRTPAYLLIPKGTRKSPAMLCLHPTNNDVGPGAVAGLDAKRSLPYAVELTERGYVTLAPAYPLLAKYQPDVLKLGWQSGTLKAVWDNMRGLDLLASLPNVDADRLGTIGHSLGGHNSVFTAVFDPRLKVVVSCCGLDSFVDYQGGKPELWVPEKGWCQLRYMPALVNYRGRLTEIPFDFHELIGSLAPRHVLIIAPKGDSNFQADSVDRIAAAARPVFKLYGSEERLRVEHPDCGHDFPVPMREAAYQWIDRSLRDRK